jgi:hypothetical protein
MKFRLARISTPVLQPVTTTAVAGLVGLAVHSVLMAAKDVLGILPEFQHMTTFSASLARGPGRSSAALYPI